MTLDPETLKQIEDQISRALAANTLVYQMRIDLALKEAAQARGVAESANSSIERSIEGLARELHNGLGRLDNQIANLNKDAQTLAVTVATNEHNTRTMRTSLFGDERPNAPSIQKDIDRLVMKTNAIGADLVEVSNHSVRLNNMLADYERLRHDLRYFLIAHKLVQVTADKLIKPFWQVLDKYKWARFFVGASPLIAAAIEFLKALIEAANK